MNFRQLEIEALYADLMRIDYEIAFLKYLTGDITKADEDLWKEFQYLGSCRGHVLDSIVFLEEDYESYKVRC